MLSTLLRTAITNYLILINGSSVHFTLKHLIFKRKNFLSYKILKCFDLMRHLFVLFYSSFFQHKLKQKKAIQEGQ